MQLKMWTSWKTVVLVACAGALIAAVLSFIQPDRYISTGVLRVAGDKEFSPPLEALSRGASKVVFVEQSRPATELIRSNLEMLGLKTFYRLMNASVLSALPRLHDPFDYVFLDPPYRLENEYGTTLKLLANSALLKPLAEIIAEHSSRYDPGSDLAGLKRYRKLEQGDAALSFYRLKSPLS